MEDNRVIMDIEVHEFVEDDAGGHFIKYMRKEDVTAHADRPDDLCKLCGFDAYPKCLENCTVGKFGDQSRE